MSSDFEMFERDDARQDAVVGSGEKFVLAEASQKTNFELQLTADELVELYECLSEVVQSAPGLMSVKERLRTILIGSMRGAAKIDSMLVVIKKLAKAEQAAAYLRGQRKKIRSLNGDACLFDSEHGEALTLDMDDGTAAELQRGAPRMPLLKSLRERRRRARNRHSL